MAKQLAFYFEQKYCSGCCTCQVACKDKNNLKVGQLFRSVHEVSGGGYRQTGAAIVQDVYAFWLSISCNHCAKPACVENCPTGALSKRAEDGIVDIDQRKCSGCQLCVRSCPYGALQLDSDMGKVRKCDFCRDLLADGKPPACIAACPMRALEYGTLDELQKKYGTVNQTLGMPDATITSPSLVISPHRSAVERKP
ncbi:MAG TPA: DMSO/selenate family reductase complex B subunit [Negativicutes bacterium]|nr:DMSO/selenate family reductase complex B subunit [Negativicutes bacterium]